MFIFVKNSLMNKKLPLKCPSCENPLFVKQMICENCQTEVTGIFSFPLIMKFSIEDQVFIIDFVKASGSLKVMAQQMKLSYPTVRNRLDEIISRIQDLEKNEK
jgi:hypothetical protein